MSGGLFGQTGLQDTYGRVFNVSAYGAKCDGQVGYYGQAVSGSNVFTDPTASFTDAVMGKKFTMLGTGSAGGNWAGTITGFTATTLTISTTAGANSLRSGATGAAVGIGTNNVTITGETFTHDDDGAIVTVAGAGPAGGTLTGQMLAPFVSGGGMYLATPIGDQSTPVNATATVSNVAWTLNRGLYLVASDDTAAWQAAIDAAIADGSHYPVTWSGVSAVSAPVVAASAVTISGTGNHPVQPGMAFPTRGSVLIAHGDFTGGDAVLMTTGTGQTYAADAIGVHVEHCTISANRSAPWAIKTRGNYATFDRVVGCNGTSGAVWLNGWQTSMIGCVWMQPGLGDVLYVTEADAEMIGGQCKSGQVLVHLGPGANDFTMKGSHTWNSWAPPVGGTNYTILADGTNVNRASFSNCLFDNILGPQVRLVAPAGHYSIEEFEFIGCKFFQNGGWFAFPDNTHPVFQFDSTADANALVDRIIVSGCSGAGRDTTHRYKALVEFLKAPGGQDAITFSDTILWHCAAIYVGSSPDHVSFNHVKIHNGTTLMTAPWPLSGDNTVTRTGNGSTTVYTVAHGMNGTPKQITVTAKTAAAAAPFYVTVDNTNVTITYVTAPANLAALGWWIRAEL